MAERVRRHLLSQLLCLGRHTLTGVLGQGRRLPAVGGIVRPEALLALVLGQEEEAQACG